MLPVDVEKVNTSSPFSFLRPQRGQNLRQCCSDLNLGISPPSDDTWQTGLVLRGRGSQEL